MKIAKTKTTPKNSTISINPEKSAGHVTRSRKREPRLCDNCPNDQEAVIWCPQCDGGQGFALCQACSNFLHLRRKHEDMTDVNNAPKVPKQYVPQAYRAPFALLVGLFSGHTKEPKTLSMTEDELRYVAQALTDTDLFDKSPGKMFGGFDSIDNLISRDLVKRESTQKPTYALKQSGIELGKRLLKFHTAVCSVLKESQVPTIPQGIAHNLQYDEGMPILLIDEMERKKTRMVELTMKRGLKTEVRNLASGDYIWLVTVGGVEMVLPCIVERKTWNDFDGSVQDRRFYKQVANMKRLGFRNRFYLVEGNMADMRDKPTQEKREYFNMCLDDLILDGFKVNFTCSWFKTAEWLTQLTHIIAEAFKQGQFDDCLMPYKEYTRIARAFIPAEEEHKVPVYHQWNADDYMDVIFRSSTIQISDRMKAKLIKNGLDLLHQPHHQHLLVMQGLEAYNKRRQKILNDSLIRAFSDKTKTVKDLVRPCLMETQALLHYDVQQYYSLFMQIRMDVYVIRKETTVEIDRLRTKFLEKNLASQFSSRSVRKNRSEEMHSSTNTATYKKQWLSKYEDDDLKKALDLSSKDINIKNEICDEDKNEFGLFDADPTHQEYELLYGKQNFRADVESKEMKLAIQMSLEENSKENNTEDDDLKLAIQMSLKESPNVSVNYKSIEEDEEYARKFYNEVNENDVCKKSTGSSVMDDARKLQEDFLKEERNAKVQLDVSRDEEIARKLQETINKNPTIDPLTSDVDLSTGNESLYGFSSTKNNFQPYLSSFNNKVKPEMKQTNSIAETYTPYSARKRKVILDKGKQKIENQIENYRHEQHKKYQVGNSKYSIPVSKSIYPTSNFYGKRNIDETMYIEDSDDDISKGKKRLSLKDDVEEVEVTDLSSSSSQLTAEQSQGNMTCGACRQKGHNRKWKLCPMYYTDEEMKRRDNEKTARREKREQELKIQQDAINALQDQQRQYQESIGNISVLINSINKKGKSSKKK